MRRTALRRSFMTAPFVASDAVLYDHCDCRVKCCMTNFPNGCVRQVAASAVLLLSYGQVPPVSSALAQPEVVIPITTLAPDGEGSLRRALDDPRPRLVVF